MTLLMFCSKLILENDVSVLLHIVSKYVGFCRKKMRTYSYIPKYVENKCILC